MGLLTNLKDSISRAASTLFSEEDPKRIGIYGPPNAGKTTLANRIARDWTGDAVGPESHVPHETRRARRKENVEIERDGKKVTIDIVDTPGVTTKGRLHRIPRTRYGERRRRSSLPRSD